jgi:hypothetical protein
MMPYWSAVASLSPSHRLSNMHHTLKPEVLCTHHPVQTQTGEKVPEGEATEKVGIEHTDLLLTPAFFTTYQLFLQWATLTLSHVLSLPSSQIDIGVTSAPSTRLHTSWLKPAGGVGHCCHSPPPLLGVLLIPSVCSITPHSVPSCFPAYVDVSVTLLLELLASFPRVDHCT